MKNRKSKESVLTVSKKIDPTYSQIVIDLFQDDLDELLENEHITPDDIGAFHYNVENLIEVFNPVFEKDILLLSELSSALSDWNEDQDFINKTLGLDPNK